MAHPEAVNRECNSTIHWVPDEITGIPLDVDQSLWSREITEECGGWDIFPDSGSVSVTENGFYVHSEHEPFFEMCGDIYINKYGQMFVSNNGDDQDCLNRAIVMLECAKEKELDEAKKTKIEQNLANLRQVPMMRHNGICETNMELYTVRLGFNILCNEDVATDRCQDHISSTGAVYTYVTEDGVPLFSVNRFNVIYSNVISELEKNPSNLFLRKLKIFMDLAKQDPGLFPPEDKSF
jgi:hypothetical protein